MIVDISREGHVRVLSPSEVAEHERNNDSSGSRNRHYAINDHEEQY